MMDGGSGPQQPAAGGPALHLPVLLPEVLAALAPREGTTILDGTFGAGGYTRGLLAHPGVRVVGLDRDPTARAAATDVAAAFPDRFTFRQARFGTLDGVAESLGLAPLAGVVLDIGVSSMQFDQAERGFSFRGDGPLDMRMDREGPTAADLVNTADEAALAAILFHLGEERESRRIARAVVADRVAKPFTRTNQLAELVARVVRLAAELERPVADVATARELLGIA